MAAVAGLLIYDLLLTIDYWFSPCSSCPSWLDISNCGWGIRYSIRNGRAYNVSGNKGVQLVFSTGKKVLIGSQKPEQLEAVIRSIM